MENSNIIKKNKRSVGFVDIITPDRSNPTTGQRSIRGTAFIVSKEGIIATNAHVYSEIPEDQKQFLGFNFISGSDEKIYTRHEVELLKIDNNNDLVLLKVKFDKKISFEPVKLGDIGIINEGDEVLALGHPLATELLKMNLGITLISNQCIISSIKAKADNTLLFFFIDIHINLGSSGSPIFSKSTGEVIGIVSGRIGTKIPIPDLQNNKNMEIPANLGICRPVNYLKDLINKK